MEVGSASGNAAADSLTIASFNIWGIPMASHAVLSRPARCGELAAAAVLPTVASEERVVLCFQEAWAFKTGLAAPCIALARALERCWPSCFTSAHTQTFNARHICSEVLRVNGCCTLLASLLAILTSTCFGCACLRDDQTKEEIVATLKLWGLPFAVGRHGSSGLSGAPLRKLMDSGLLIVTNVAPVATGFEAFESVGVEGAANKGFLWALLPPPSGVGDALSGGGDLVITTHQHADQPNHNDPGATRAEQRAEMVRAVARLREQYRPRLVLLCGDFNEDAERREPTCLHADLTKPPLSFSRLTECKAAGTCLKDDGSGRTEELDHVYAGVAADGPSLVCEPRPPLRTPWSDHSLIWVNKIRLEGKV